MWWYRQENDYSDDSKHYSPEEACHDKCGKLFESVEMRRSDEERVIEIEDGFNTDKKLSIQTI